MELFGCENRMQNMYSDNVPCHKTVTEVDPIKTNRFRAKTISDKRPI